MEKQQVAPSDDWLDLGAKALEVDDSTNDEGGEDQVDGDTDLLESVADDDQAEPETDEAEVEVEAEDDASPDVWEWDGDPNKLPDPIEHDGKLYDLRKAHKSMLAGYTKKSQEMSDRDRARDEALQRTLAELDALKAQRSTEDDPRPADPSEDMPYDMQRERWDEIARWNAREQHRADVKAGRVPDPNRMQQQIQEYEQKHAATEFAAYIRSLDGWTEEIQAGMAELATNDPYWTSAPMTKEAGAALFNIVKTKQEADALRSAAATKEANKVRKQARAPKNVVPRSSGSKSSKAAETYKKMSYDDIRDAAIAESGD